MKRLLLPILILSFSFASAQDIVSNQDVIEDVVITENVVINNDNQDEVAYTAKTLTDPDNIDFKNLHNEKQLELFVTEENNNIC